MKHYSRASKKTRSDCPWKIHFAPGLTLKMSPSESLYGGQFTLSTQLIKPNYPHRCSTTASLETYSLYS